MTRLSDFSRTSSARLGMLLAVVILCCAPTASRAGEQLIGTSCSGNKNNVDWDTIGQCVSSTFQRVSPFLAGSVAIGATSMTTGTVLDMGSKTNSMLLPVGTTGQEPTGVAGMIRYNSTTSAVEFYNGTSWQTALSVGSTGYFVLTKTTYNGSMGGLSGANANCLTELTTNTGWMGYSTANANGQLIGSKVKAFLCNDSSSGTDGVTGLPYSTDPYECSTGSPNSTYLFANANNAAYGGGSFTTDNNAYPSFGSANWSGSAYFGGDVYYWASGGSYYAPYENTCDSWNSSNSGINGLHGYSNGTTGARLGNGNSACNSTLPVICIVNP